MKTVPNERNYLRLIVMQCIIMYTAYPTMQCVPMCAWRLQFLLTSYIHICLHSGYRLAAKLFESCLQPCFGYSSLRVTLLYCRGRKFRRSIISSNSKEKEFVRLKISSIDHIRVYKKAGQIDIRPTFNLVQKLLGRKRLN